MEVSRFLTNVPSFAALACRCDASHSHDAWGAQWSPSGWRFATHLEAQYPRLLCRRIVDALCSSLTPSQVRALAPSVSLHTDALATLAVQSRRFPPLVSEFRQVVHLPADAPKPTNSKTLLPGDSSGSLGVAGARAFDKVGIYRTPEEFMVAANRVRHPMDTQNPLAKVTCDALDTIFGQDPKYVRLKRKTNLLKVQLLAKQLAQEEDALRASMSDGTRKVLGHKKVGLMGTSSSSRGIR